MLEPAPHERHLGGADQHVHRVEYGGPPASLTSIGCPGRSGAPSRVRHAVERPSPRLRAPPLRPRRGRRGRGGPPPGRPRPGRPGLGGRRAHHLRPRPLHLGQRVPGRRRPQRRRRSPSAASRSSSTPRAPSGPGSRRLLAAGEMPTLARTRSAWMNDGLRVPELFHHLLDARRRTTGPSSCRRTCSGRRSPSARSPPSGRSCAPACTTSPRPASSCSSRCSPGRPGCGS